MIKIGISADLERRLRATKLTDIDREYLIGELCGLLDGARAKDKPPAGLGYRAIVAALRVGLGNRLAVPPNPSTAWIIKMVNRAKELGLGQEELERLGTIVSRTGRVAEVEWILYRAAGLLAGDASRDRQAGRPDTDVPGPGSTPQQVVVGRRDPGADE